MTARCVTVMGPLTAILTLGAAFCASAQERSSAVEGSAPNLEIGAAASGFVAARTFGLGVRVSKMLDHRFSFEAGLDWMELGRKQRLADQMVWFYFLQAKQALTSRERAGPNLFLTYGAAGWVDRSAARDGWYYSLIPPLLPMVGLGGQHVVARYAAVRIDAQLVIWLFSEAQSITPRLSAGVSVPIGGYQR